MFMGTGAGTVAGNSWGKRWQSLEIVWGYSSLPLGEGRVGQRLVRNPVGPPCTPVLHRENVIDQFLARMVAAEVRVPTIRPDHPTEETAGLQFTQRVTDLVEGEKRQTQPR